VSTVRHDVSGFPPPSAVAGVRGAEAAVELATRVNEYPTLRLMGLHAYHGPAQHMRKPVRLRSRPAGLRPYARLCGRSDV
jgi:D-serine deaminase-like pyridoxal phosphate-dependent protein